jgi:hypothetical protein
MKNPITSGRIMNFKAQTGKQLAAQINVFAVHRIMQIIRGSKLYRG